MDPSELQRIKAVFTDALERNGAERERFLEKACGDDAAFRAEVNAFLAAAEREADALIAPLTTVAPSMPTTDLPREGAGETIGNYKLLQLIGEGGFGSVFMAEQEAPVRRRVALKIIKLGMDTKQVIARFEAERQALAMMDHPNIAKIFDAGATASGRPYFVMELVKGIPITQYCDMNKLATEARLELFVAVCNALQHAHQKGVIHRDIKPSNILVTLHDGKPVPKLIDFGIAKATQSRLTEKTLFTEFNQLIGTPLYMSPEQAEMSGLDVDTRSDIYSLGVLLYELLTGTTPFDPREMRSAAYAELLRMIREVDPPKPSTRLSTLGEPLTAIAANRDVEPRRLSQLVRGELDWIVMKSLEKDRTRRYESAGEMARDIVRHLEDQPVEACPPSQIYRLKKFARRNRAGVLTTGAIAMLALAATIIYVRGIRIEQHKTELALSDARAQRAQAQAQKQAADQQRDEAQRQKAEADHQRDEAHKQELIAVSVNNFLSNMLSSADPDRLLGDKVTVLQAIESAEKQLDAGIAGLSSLTEASVRTTIGSTLFELGRYADAERNFRKALELRRQAPPEAKIDISWNLTNLAVTLADLNRPAEAESLYREALALQLSSRPARDPLIGDTLVNIANLEASQNRPDEAEKLYRRALTTYRPNEAARAHALNNLGTLLTDHGRPAEGEAMLREALAMDQAGLGPGHPTLAAEMNNLANLLRRENKLPEAEKLFREALAIERKALPAGHPSISLTLNNFAALLAQQDKVEEAQKLYREALEIDRKAHPPGHPQISKSLNNLAGVVPAEEAEPLYREALEIERKSLPAGHPEIASGVANLAMVNDKLGKSAEAEALYIESLKLERSALPKKDPAIAMNLRNYAHHMISGGRLQEAEPLMREALDMDRARFGEHPETVTTLNALAKLMWDLHKPDDSEKLYREALAMERKVLPAGNKPIMLTLWELFGVLVHTNRFKESEPVLREILENTRKYFPEMTWQLGNATSTLGFFYAKMRRWADAEPLLREGLAIREKEYGMNHIQTQFAADALRIVLIATGRPEEAEAVRAAHGLPMPATQPASSQPAVGNGTANP